MALPRAAAPQWAPDAGYMWLLWEVAANQICASHTEPPPVQTQLNGVVNSKSSKSSSKINIQCDESQSLELSRWADIQYSCWSAAAADYQLQRPFFGETFNIYTLYSLRTRFCFRDINQLHSVDQENIILGSNKKTPQSLLFDSSLSKLKSKYPL